MKMTAQHPQQMLFLVIALLMVGQLGETLYLPAMPIIVEQLQCTNGQAQWILSAYLIGFGGSQFIYGPLSDYYGRRPIVLFSLCIYLLGSLLCVFATNAYTLITGSLVAGIGIGSSGLMARTAVRDLFEGSALQKALSIVGIAVVFTPMAAPVFGAYLMEWFGWRADFAFFLLAGSVFWLICYYRFDETNAYRRSRPLSFHVAAAAYRDVLFNPTFMRNMLCGMMNLAALMAYEVVAPFLFQQQLGYSPVAYAWIALVPVLGFLGGSFLSGVMSEKYDTYAVAVLGNILVCIGAVVLFLPIIFDWMHLWGILAPIVVFMFGSGLLFSSTTAGALMPFAHESGVAGATIGGFQNVGAGLMTATMSMLEVDRLGPLVITFAIATLLGTGFFALGGIRQPKTPAA